MAGACVRGWDDFNRLIAFAGGEAGKSRVKVDLYRQ